MRPVNKGTTPYTSIHKYQDALPYLKKRLGAYCSYCEMKVTTNLAVEHKESKNSGGSKTDWNNLLLACTYCNSRKGENVKLGQKGRWIWPDENNTLLPFSYKGGVPQMKEYFLKTMSTPYNTKVRNTFSELALDYCPTPDDDIRDTRYENRISAYGKAKRAKKKWQKIKGTSMEADEVVTICDMATETGFFSMWMEVFEGEEQVRRELIKTFLGTNQSCFDSKTNPVKLSTDK